MEAKDIIKNPSAERNILNIIMKNNDNLVLCSAQDLYSEHFAVEANQVIYSVVCYLTQQGIKHFDANTIYSVVTDPDAIEKLNSTGIDGRIYIDGLLEQQTIEENLKLNIDLVKECNTKRMIYSLGEQIKKEVIETKDITKTLADLQSKLLTLSLDTESKAEVYKFGDSAYERFVQRMNNPCETFGYKIGWDKFDKITQGMGSNDLVILVGPSKTGKSTWLLNVTDSLSIKSGLKGLYIDTEMKDDEQEDRLVAIVSGVPFEEIRNGMFGQDTEFGQAEDKKKKVFDAIEIIKNTKMFHKYIPDFTIDKVSALIRKYKIQENIDFVIFDYIKLPSGDVNSLNSAQEYQRLGYFTSCLKDMAGICGIPVISACQTNRNDLNTTDPDASNIGGSYRILQLATKLLFIRNKTPNELENENYALGNQKLHIKYQRNGGGDEAVDVVFDRPVLRMCEV